MAYPLEYNSYPSPPSGPRTEPDWLGLCQRMVMNSKAAVRTLLRELRIFENKEETSRLTQKEHDKMTMITFKLHEAEDLLSRWKLLCKDAVMEREEDMGLREKFESSSDEEEAASSDTSMDAYDDTAETGAATDVNFEAEEEEEGVEDIDGEDWNDDSE